MDRHTFKISQHLNWNVSLYSFLDGIFFCSNVLHDHEQNLTPEASAKQPASDKQTTHRQRERLGNPCLVSRNMLSLVRNVRVMYVCSQEITWKDKHPTYVKAKFKQLIRLWKQHPKSNNLRLEYKKQNTSLPITSMPKKTPGKSIKLCFKCFKKKQFQCFFGWFPMVFDPTFAGGVTSPFGLSNQRQTWMISSWNTQLYRGDDICWKKSLETTNTYRYKLSFKLSLIEGGKKKVLFKIIVWRIWHCATKWQHDMSCESKHPSNLKWVL